MRFYNESDGTAPDVMHPIIYIRVKECAQPVNAQQTALLTYRQ